MLIYRGDKFVKGKKFKINENVYKFNKRDRNDNLIFESVKTNEILKLTEAEALRLTRYSLNRVPRASLLQEGAEYIAIKGVMATKRNLNALYDSLLSEGAIEEGLTLPIYTFFKSPDHYIALNKKDLINLNSKILENAEPIEDDDEPFVVEIWETEEDRDMGEGFIYKSFKTREEAMKCAEDLWNGINDYAAVEAYNEKTGDSICCGADGSMEYYNEDQA